MASTEKETFSKRIAERIRAERERLGLTQAAFAEIGGVGRATQLFYENVDRYPDTLYLEKLSQAGVDIAYLVSGTRSLSSFNDAEWLHFKPEVLWEMLIAAHKVARPEMPQEAIESILASFKAYCAIYSGRKDDFVVDEVRASVLRLEKCA